MTGYPVGATLAGLWVYRGRSSTYTTLELKYQHSHNSDKWTACFFHVTTLGFDFTVLQPRQYCRNIDVLLHLSLLSCCFDAISHTLQDSKKCWTIMLKYFNVALLLISMWLSTKIWMGLVKRMYRECHRCSGTFITLVPMGKLVPNYDVSTSNNMFRSQLCHKNEDWLCMVWGAPRLIGGCSDMSLKPLFQASAGSGKSIRSWEVL